MAVKSTGLVFFLIVPIGAFVEIDEKVIQKAKFRQSGRVMAGGPGSNILVALLALALLLLLVGGLVPAQFNGVNIGGVVSPKPRVQPLHESRDSTRRLIVAVNGTAVHSVSQLLTYMAGTHPNESLTLSISHNGHISNYTMILGKNRINNTTTVGLIGVTQSKAIQTFKTSRTPMRVLSSRSHCYS